MREGIKEIRGIVYIVCVVIIYLIISTVVYANDENDKEENEFFYGEVGDVYRVGKNDDFSDSEKEALDSDDYGYGWTMGKFRISGFSSYEEYKGSDDNYKGSKVYIKNSGDKIRLSFILEQDIEKLDGNDSLYIKDAKSRDKYFQTKKIDMGKGALIVRFTDHKGKKHNPKIYTNYFKSLKVGKETQISMDGPDTNIYFFEEGDYEVALDYRIGKEKNGPLFIDPKDPYEDYRVFFKFSIRNGNSMFFIRDLETGNELTNESPTAKGFVVDYAGSKYIKVNVKKEEITEGRDGLVEDTRYNRPIKDKEECTEPGIYTLTVTNDYSNENTIKKIYVGEDDVMMKLIKSSYTIEEIEEMLKNGTTINDQGATEIPTDNIEESSNKEEITTKKENQDNKSKNDSLISIISIISVVIVLCIAGMVVLLKNTKKKKDVVIYEDEELEEDDSKKDIDND